MLRSARALQRISVRTRLMVWNISIVALLLALLGGIVRVTLQRVLEGSVDSGLHKDAASFVAQARELLLRDRNRDGPFGGDGRGPLSPRDGPGFGPPLGPPQDRGLPFGPSSRALDEQRRRSFVPRIFNLSRQAMRPYQNAGAWDQAALDRAFRNEEVFSSVTFDDEPVRVLSYPVRWRGSVVGAVQAAHPVAETRQAIAAVNQTLLALVPLGLIFAGVAGAAVTGRALKPVGQIARTAEHIDEHDLTRRLEVFGSDEFSYLASTFNRMLGRLETAFDRQKSLVTQLEALLEEQKRFTADASHELKTPLAVAKVHAGLLLRAPAQDADTQESIRSIDDAVDRMGRLVQDLLLLARHDAGRAVMRQSQLDVRDLVLQARQLQAACDRPEIRLERFEAGLTVLGDEDELVRVFSNLLGNAVRHSRDGGVISVSACRSNGIVRTSFADTGEGIAPEHLAHLGERFYRADSSRSRGQGGAGLGLAICKSILEEHQGSLEFKSTVGVGTTVTVTLPAENVSA